MNETTDKSSFGQFWAEMRRRHVVRFAIGYAAAVFVVLQLAEIIFPAFGIGEDGLRLLVIVTTLGFIPAIVLAWIYDLTKDGIRRTEGDTTGLKPITVGGLIIVCFGITGSLGLWMAERAVLAEGTLGIGDPAEAVRLATYDPSAPIRSLAVLPLEDNSPGGDQDYFTASMHEELIAKLSMLDEIRVVSRTSVMRYAGTTTPMPQIGRELDVDVIIEGSVTRQGERTRVTLRLTHAASESHIETLQWDREEVKDVLAFQSEIAHDVVHQVSTVYDETTFAQTAASIAPEAQDSYFRGRFEYDRGTPEGYRMALEHFEDAIQADPDFAAAMAGMAGARFLIGLEDDTIEAEELALVHQEALAAIQLDSASPEAREVLSLIEKSMPTITGDLALAAPIVEGPQVHVMTFGDEADSISVDVTALDTAWVSTVTSIGGRIQDRVTRWRARASGGAEPAGPTDRRTWQAQQMLSAAQYTEAGDLLEEVVEASPHDGRAWEMLVRSRVAIGDVDAAEEAVQAWHDSGAEGAPSEADVSDLSLALELEGTRGYWNWTAQRLDELVEAGRDVPRMELATAHAALGHADVAFDYLVEAIARGEPTVFAVRQDPAWDDLRADPRFAEIGERARSLRNFPARPPQRGRR